jgi:hypothetical protein
MTQRAVSSLLDLLGGLSFPVAHGEPALLGVPRWLSHCTLLELATDSPDTRVQCFSSELQAVGGACRNGDKKQESPWIPRSTDGTVVLSLQHHNNVFISCEGSRARGHPCESKRFVAPLMRPINHTAENCIVPRGAWSDVHVV